ncbi:MAG: glycosyltransferase family 4 protein [Steroidobacteraceae bacterium]
MSGDAAAVSADVIVGRSDWSTIPIETSAAAALRGVRVIHVGPALDVKGGVSSVQRLIMEELQRDLDVRHIASTCEGGWLAKAACYAQALRAFRQELKASPRTIVHVHFASRGSTWRKLFIASMALRAGAMLVLHAHGGGFDRFLSSQPSFAREWIKSTFQQAKLFVVLSTHWRDFYIERLGIDPARVRVLWNPTRMPEDVSDRRGRQIVHLAYLGLISEAKGAFDLVRAVSQLPSGVRQRVKLTVAGNGELQRIRAMAAPLGAGIDVRSWITAEQRDRLLQEADIYVLPSYFEGVPMSILEALAAGLPVIASRVGGIPEIVAHEKTGLLIEAGDVEALSRQIQRLVTDEALRLEYGKAARISAERFDVRRYSHDLIEHYRSLSASS